jgi:hypothetical protein
VEVLRRMRGATLPDAVTEYGATRLCESQLHRAETLLGVPVTTRDTWDRIRAVAGAARRVNVSEQMFDSMSEENQGHILRAETIHRALAALLEDDTAIRPQPGALEVVCLTEAGKQWRDFGGVVLDATAPVHELLALRPDARVVDIAVRDAADSETVRILTHTPGVSRTALALRGEERRGEALGAVAVSINRNLARLEKRLGRKPKVLVITYKAHVEALRVLVNSELVADVDFKHYGNTRGYDGWFQAGFDCFVTVGDPYSNVVTDELIHTYLKVEADLDSFSAYRARSELAQSHGRARSVQAKRGDGVRLALHYGRLAPLDWNSGNCMVEGLGT